MKKKLIVILCVVLAVAGITVLGLNIYSKKQMEKIPGMTVEECLAYTLEGEEDGVITIGTIRNGEREWTVYGCDGKELPKELHTYEIGSLTKTITASLVARAVAEDKIHIEDTIDQYLSLPPRNVYPTIEELLTHTSGYKEYYYEAPMKNNFFAGRNSFCGITDEMVLNRVGKMSMDQEEYSWRYSNFGIAVLGQILEEVYGEEYTDMVNGFLAELDMPDSHISTGEGDLEDYWEWEPYDAYMPAGAMVSSIEDVLTYAELQLQNEGIFADTHKVLKEVNATPENYAMLDMRVDAMGMAWIVDEEHGFLWHNGATGHYNCYLGYCIETQTAVVVLSNLSPNYRIPATVIGIKLLESLQADGEAQREGSLTDGKVHGEGSLTDGKQQEEGISTDGKLRGEDDSAGGELQGEGTHLDRKAQGETIPAMADVTDDLNITNANGETEDRSKIVESESSLERVDMEKAFYITEITDEIFARMQGKSYKDNCTLPREDLRYLHVLHVDLDGVTHEGEMVVNVHIAEDVLEILKELYKAGYPIEKIRLVDEYDADDEASMEDNNSSSFNFRFISYTTTVSKHGLGLAVDINTLYNPYVKTVNGKRSVEPVTAEAYLDRTADFPYKIDEDDLCYRLFTEHGFEWGGHWEDAKDYQHFEVPDSVIREWY